jgi:hypothetical protein
MKNSIVLVFESNNVIQFPSLLSISTSLSLPIPFVFWHEWELLLELLREHTGSVDLMNDGHWFPLFIQYETEFVSSHRRHALQRCNLTTLRTLLVHTQTGLGKLQRLRMHQHVVLRRDKRRGNEGRHTDTRNEEVNEEKQWDGLITSRVPLVCACLSLCVC